MLRVKKSASLAQPQTSLAIAAAFVPLAVGGLQVICCGFQGIQEFHKGIVGRSGWLCQIEPATRDPELACRTAVGRFSVGPLIMAISEIDIALYDPTRVVEQAVYVAR